MRFSSAPLGTLGSILSEGGVRILLVFSILAIIFEPLQTRANDNNNASGVSPFSAEGIFSMELFRAHETNYHYRQTGSVKFIYTNRLWEIQYKYGSIYSDISNGPSARMGTVLDLKRIADGTRLVVLAAPDHTNNGDASTASTAHHDDRLKNHNASRDLRDYAQAFGDAFPKWIDQGLLLPWLSLCPSPELPFLNSNHISIFWMPEFRKDSENSGTFAASYIKPEGIFLSELLVTNTGYWPGFGKIVVPDSNGFPAFSYNVSSTTNYQGILFPLNTILSVYAPLPDAKSSGDIYTTMISRFSLTKFIFDDQEKRYRSVPAHLIALDNRLARNLKDTVNYPVDNDSWNSITNTRLQRLAKIIK